MVDHHHHNHLSFKIRSVFPGPVLLGTIFSIGTLTHTETFTVTVFPSPRQNTNWGPSELSVYHSVRGCCRPCEERWGEERQGGRRQLVNIFHFIIDNRRQGGNTSHHPHIPGQLAGPPQLSVFLLVDPQQSVPVICPVCPSVPVLWKQPGVYIMSEHNRWSSLSPHNT